FAIPGLPLVDLAVRVPPWIEVDIFNAPNVIDSVDRDAATKRLASNIPYVVALILAGINALIGIQQFDIENRRILSAHGDRPRVGNRLRIGLLFRIVDSQTANRAVGVQREEWLSVLASSPCIHKQRGSVISRLRLSFIANSIVRRN